MSYGITNWWPAGKTVELTGAFTMGAVGSDGIVDVTLASDDDEAIFMYGSVIIGGTKAGGADTMTVSYMTVAGAAVVAQIEAVAMNASESLYLPTAFADAAVAVANSIGMNDIPCLMLSHTDVLRFHLAGMANTETYSLKLRFRSRSGVQMTGTPTGGGFA